MTLSRRQALAIGAAAIVAPALPAAAAAAPGAQLLPAWAVGSEGEFNWQVIRAATEREAKLAWLGVPIAQEVVGHTGQDDCPSCDAKIGQRCKRPSGHGVWGGEPHDCRDILAFQLGHYGGPCPLGICGVKLAARLQKAAA